VTHLPQRPSAHPGPIYFGALTSPTVELAGELADVIMPLWWSPERVARSRIWGERGRAKAAWHSASRPLSATPSRHCVVRRAPISAY